MNLAKLVLTLNARIRGYKSILARYRDSTVLPDSYWLIDAQCKELQRVVKTIKEGIA